MSKAMRVAMVALAALIAVAVNACQAKVCDPAILSGERPPAICPVGW